MSHAEAGVVLGAQSQLPERPGFMVGVAAPWTRRWEMMGGRFGDPLGSWSDGPAEATIVVSSVAKHIALLGCRTYVAGHMAGCECLAGRSYCSFPQLNSFLWG